MLQFLQHAVCTGCWVVCHWEVGHEMAVWRLVLEGAAESAEKRQELADGGHGTLSQEGELQRVRGRFLTQAVQLLGKTQTVKTWESHCDRERKIRSKARLATCGKD